MASGWSSLSPDFHEYLRRAHVKRKRLLTLKPVGPNLVKYVNLEFGPGSLFSGLRRGSSDSLIRFG